MASWCIMGCETIMECRDDSKTAPDARGDSELIVAINNGDSEAFSELYDHYRDWVVRQANHLTGDPELALDVLQETFLYFLKKFPGFRLTAQLKTFLYPAIRNLSIAARRKATRFQNSLDVAEIETSAVTVSPEPGDEESIAAVLDLLSAEHREVLRLRFVDGLKLDEIAEALELPLGTIKSRLHNALKTLRQDPRTRKLFDR